MRELVPVIAVLTLMATAAILPALLHRWRRRHWRRIVARIDAAYYAAPERTALPLIDVSFRDHGETRLVKGLLRHGTDVEDLVPGGPIRILVSPVDSRRCVIDE
ncbi:hypothetical protein [Paracoccus sp. (in: a-proteobacteria)]|jgi:hypothetical protein|uniref:hypothetical protein n=1 Tax=Paracoccus sp. TaxID=267 RepID=UPI00258DE992|nr:hypothetical protein [Paracoccus sp. (in: a-proteobacteria)]